MFCFSLPKALYIKYGLGLPDQYPYIVGVLIVRIIFMQCMPLRYVLHDLLPTQVFTVLWMPVWHVVMRKYGKATVYKAAMFVGLRNNLLYSFDLFCFACIDNDARIHCSIISQLFPLHYLPSGNKQWSCYSRNNPNSLVQMNKTSA